MDGIKIPTIQGRIQNKKKKKKKVVISQGYSLSNLFKIEDKKVFYNIFGPREIKKTLSTLSLVSALAADY